MGQLLLSPVGNDASDIYDVQLSLIVSNKHPGIGLVLILPKNEDFQWWFRPNRDNSIDVIVEKLQVLFFPVASVMLVLTATIVLRLL